MIYMTGDCHGGFEKLQPRPWGRMPGAGDTMIVCGDFGLLWSKSMTDTFEENCRQIENLPFQLLWVAGNHENYHWLYEYPVEKWNGGKVRKILGEKCIYLERGQIFEIEGKKIFTFGGAGSHDIQGGILDIDDPDYQERRREAIHLGLPYRVRNISWWQEELPTKEEMQEAVRNLAAADNQVDYIITHCASTRIQNLLCVYESSRYSYKPDILTDFFDTLEEQVHYKRWYFGHYHQNIRVDEKHILLLEEIVPAEDGWW